MLPLPRMQCIEITVRVLFAVNLEHAEVHAASHQEFAVSVMTFGAQLCTMLFSGLPYEFNLHFSPVVSLAARTYD